MLRGVTRPSWLIHRASSQGRAQFWALATRPLKQLARAGATEEKPLLWPEEKTKDSTESLQGHGREAQGDEEGRLTPSAVERCGTLWSARAAIRVQPAEKTRCPQCHPHSHHVARGGHCPGARLPRARAAPSAARTLLAGAGPLQVRRSHAGPAGLVRGRPLPVMERRGSSTRVRCGRGRPPACALTRLLRGLVVKPPHCTAVWLIEPAALHLGRATGTGGRQWEHRETQQEAERPQPPGPRPPRTSTSVRPKCRHPCSRHIHRASGKLARLARHAVDRAAVR